MPTQSQYSGSNEPSDSSAERRLRSFVWDHFTLSSENNDRVAKCKQCNYVKPYLGTTTLFIYHLERKHKIRQKVESVKRTIGQTICDESSSEDDDDDEGNREIKNRGMSAAKKLKVDRALVKWLVSSNQPAVTVGSEEFDGFIKSLNSDYKPPCRQTISTRLIPSYVCIFYAKMLHNFT